MRCTLGAFVFSDLNQMDMMRNPLMLLHVTGDLGKPCSVYLNQLATLSFYHRNHSLCFEEESLYDGLIIFLKKCLK